MNGLFLRNCSSLSEYIKFKKIDRRYFEDSNFIVVAHKKLDRKTFQILSDDLRKKMDFIENMKFNLIKTGETAHCIEIYCPDFDYKIIGYTNGHAYLKYCFITTTP